MKITHDKIQLALLDEQKRIALLKQINEKPLVGMLVFEFHIKLDYQPEIFIDALEVTKSDPPTLDMFFKKPLVRIWEIKPNLDILGETLRQIKRYEDLVKKYYMISPVNPVAIESIVVYSESPFTHKSLQQYFGNSGVFVVKFSGGKVLDLPEAPE
jgi:hypothetical protein